MDGSSRGRSKQMGNRGYIDLEFGQIYGSYRRDFVPVDVGLLIYDPDGDRVILKRKFFPFNGDLVMRINTIDSLGNPIGLHERVFNPSKSSFFEFDPRFRITRKDRGGKEAEVHSIFKQLSIFLKSTLRKYEIDELIFFGCAEDMNLIRRSGFRITSIERKDIQKELRPEVGIDLSLDKASIIIDFRKEDGEVRSRHFSYSIPDDFHGDIVPHNAIGDVTRMFLLHREMVVHRDHLLRETSLHLKKIREYREKDEEIPVF